MWVIDKITGPIARLFKKQFSMDIKISVAPTVDKDHNVAVDIWYVTSKTKLPAGQITAEFIKAQKDTVHLDATRDSPASRSNVTVPADGYIYITAAPKGGMERTLRDHRGEGGAYYHGQS